MVARDRALSPHLAARSWDVLARDLTRATATSRVHSVFQRACNLMSADGRLLGVVVDPAVNGPATIVIEHGDSAPDFGALLAPGDMVHRAGEHLVIAARLTLDLSGVRLWRPAPIRRTISAAEVEQRLYHVARLAAAIAPDAGLAPLLRDADILAGDGRPSRFQAAQAGLQAAHVALAGPPDAPLAPSGSDLIGVLGPTGAASSAADPRAPNAPDLIVVRARAQVERMTAAIRCRRWSAVRAPAEALSGLGPGLTPAGDGLLAGLALGFRAGIGTLPAPLGTALRHAIDGRTTDLAAARVRHAVAGHADEAVYRLISALVSGTGADLDAAVESALAYGHSSGADTLVGLILGLRLGVLG